MSVLFVDDEKIIRDLMLRVCTISGIDAEAVADGQAALARCREGGIRAVVTDLGMPEMDGVALGEAIAAEHPSILRFALSGNYFDAPPGKLETIFEKTYHKPGNISQMIAEILQSLGRGESHPIE